MKAPKSISLKQLANRILCSAALTACCTTGAGAHKEMNDHTTFGLHVYVPVEYYNIDAGNLNKFLGVAELPHVQVPRIFPGIGTQIQMDRIVLNASFSMSGKRYNLDNTRLSAPFRTYGFTLGYDLMKSPFMNLQPYAGVRMGKVSYNYENVASNMALPPSGLQATSFRGRRGMLDLGVGVSWQSKLLLGFRGGVLVPTGRTKWKDGDGAQLTGGPELSYRYYLGVNIGFGRANIKVKTASSEKHHSGNGDLSFIY
jgi:hypothetical protein